MSIRRAHISKAVVQECVRSALPAEEILTIASEHLAVNWPSPDILVLDSVYLM
jgi:hypothetical protein